MGKKTKKCKSFLKYKTLGIYKCICILVSEKYPLLTCLSLLLIVC